MASRVLVLMRHAKSDWSGDELDRERPIGRRGRRQAAEAGAWLHAHVPDVEVVVTSPALRARETWEVAAQQYRIGSAAPAVRVDERIYTWSAGPMLAALRDLDDHTTTALLVGHNPGLDALVTDLSGVEVSMVTSALAVLRCEGHWRDLGSGTAELVVAGRPPSTV